MGYSNIMDKVKHTRDFSDKSVGDHYEEDGEEYIILGVVEDGAFVAPIDEQDTKMFLANEWEE